MCVVKYGLDTIGIIMNELDIEVVSSVPKKSIMDYWSKIMPDNQPRDSQMRTFEWIESLPHDVKYMLLEMPVGGGKSPVGLAISAWMSQGKGSSFILTPQKILQKQYEDSFTNQILSSMYGKSNYTCHSKNTSCDTGSTIKPRCDSCPQAGAFMAALNSNNLVLNYTLAFLYFKYLSAPPPTDGKRPRGFAPRKLMVMDECHNLESQLVSFSTLDISKYMCDKMGTIKYKKPLSITDAYKWISSEYFPALNSYTTTLSNEVDRIERYVEDSVARKISKEDQNTIKNFNAATRHESEVSDFMLIGDELTGQYVMVDGINKFSIKELYGSNAFNGLVKPMADKFLFMSSTILNKDGFCRDLGIDPDQAAFLSLDSEFPKERRVVLYKPQTKMNYGWDKPDRKAGRVKMIGAINDILDMHKDVSGIIHTGSFKLAQWVIEELTNNKTHNVLHHNPDGRKRVNRDEVIAEYMESALLRPTILVSPSITEGLDLKDDLGRFAIFAKVPYPSLADAWVKRRMEISSDWYQRQTLKEMIQGSGRICRSHEDWGMTYILDASFTYLYHSTKRKVIPGWWEDSMEII